MAKANPVKVIASRAYTDGAEFDPVWLTSTQRSDAKPYWHWRDGYNVWQNKYTIWASGFEDSDTQVCCKGTPRHT